MPPEKKLLHDPLSLSAPRLPALRSWVIGGGLLVLVLGGYWYFNRGDGREIHGSKGRPALRVRGGGVYQHGSKQPE